LPEGFLAKAKTKLCHGRASRHSPRDCTRSGKCTAELISAWRIADSGKISNSLHTGRISDLTGSYSTPISSFVVMYIICSLAILGRQPLDRSIALIDFARSLRLSC